MTFKRPERLIIAGSFIGMLAILGGLLIARGSGTVPGSRQVTFCVSGSLRLEESEVSHEFPFRVYGLRLVNTGTSACRIPMEPLITVKRAELATTGGLSSGASWVIPYLPKAPSSSYLTIGPARSASTTLTATDGCRAVGDPAHSSLRIELGDGQALKDANWGPEFTCGINAKPFTTDRLTN